MSAKTKSAPTSGDFDETLKTLTVEDVRTALKNGGYDDAILSASFVKETRSGMMYEITFRGDCGSIEKGKVFVESFTGQLFAEY